ncbi:MAG: ABC transporter permease subunit [Deltaproteobacteria bacterium]|nr:ABC transporter permease subunit [Deltaproteobacteria bacterium]
MDRRAKLYVLLMMAPAVAIFGAFFLLPLARLAISSAAGPSGFKIYLLSLTNPRYFATLINTMILSIAVTLVTLMISGFSGVFLTRNQFPGKSFIVSLLTFPLAFPGVVVGFMIILLVGRQGLFGDITNWLMGEKVVFAYSMIGLFLGYLYFSIPRVILTIMAAAEKLDPSLEEAARSLGASPLKVIKDVLIPALVPGLISSGAICFATSMGAFGTAFTLATDIDVLPIVIYTEFTLLANISTAAALSIVLGLITWVALSVARTISGTTVASAG